MTAPPKTDRRYRAVTLVGGGGLLAYLVVSIGPSTVLGSFRELSWRLLVVIVFPSVALKTLDTLAWGLAFTDERVPLRSLATALLTGQAIASTPASLIGGDAFMAWTLRGRVGLRQSVSSLIILRTTGTASRGLFLLFGILVARRTFPRCTALVTAMEWLVVLEVIGVVGFVALQSRGLVAGGYGLLGRLGFSRRAAVESVATEIDQALVTFYRRHPRRLILSLACNFLGWLTKAAEVWLILYLLHAAVSVATALVIEAFGTGISFATFFLPMDLGVEEGGAVITFVALGLAGGTGLSMNLVRRVRELAWASFGLLLLAGGARPAPAVATAHQA